MIGTAQEIIDVMAEHRFDDGDSRCHAEAPESTAAALFLADETGTSQKYRPSHGRWDDDSLMVSQVGTLPRGKLYDFLVILNGSQEWFDTAELPEAALALIDPFED